MTKVTTATSEKRRNLSEDVQEKWNRKRQFQNRDGTANDTNMFRNMPVTKTTVTKVTQKRQRRNTCEDVLEKVETKSPVSKIKTEVKVPVTC